MPFTWDLVTKNVDRYEQLEEKVREKISKLEKHLQNFPPDAVHLHTHLEKNPKKPLYTASLTLRLPSNTLHADKTEEDPMPAFDETVKALLREVESLKASLRREDVWKRKERREELHENKAARFAERPQAAPREKPSLPEVVSEMFQQHYPRLVRYAWRVIWRAELLGEISRNAIDPREVTDEVAKQAFLMADQRPDEQRYRLWFYGLLRSELERRIEQKALQGASAGSNEAGAAAVLAQKESGATPIPDEENFEPERVLIGEWLPDEGGWAIEQLISKGEFLELMRSVASTWPKADRSIFELHFLEGFTPEEVATLEGATTAEVNDRAEKIKGHLSEMAPGRCSSR